MSKDSTSDFSVEPSSRDDNFDAGERSRKQELTVFHEHAAEFGRSLSSIKVSPRILNLLSNELVDSPSLPAGDTNMAARSDAGQSTLARYRIQKELGRGGMGAVFEGWDVQLQRRVAIKVLRDAEGKKSSRLWRFFREAKLTSRLQHPAIIAVYDFDVAVDGQAFIVMERLEGQTLRQVLENVQDRSRELPSLLGTFLQVSQAVAYAHSQGVIHRDLKPANVMVGRYGVVTVLDWGLAKVIGESEPFSDFSDCDLEPMLDAVLERVQDFSGAPDNFETRVGTVFGTPGYLSPEQARGEHDRIDKRSDIFALGGTLCEILTGCPPFVGKNLNQTFSLAAAGKVSRAIARLDACVGPRSIVNIAKKCLSPSPGDRPQEVQEIVDSLVDFLESGQRRAEQELVRFFDLSLDLFCIANLSGYFCRINDNFSRLLGYSSGELTSCRFFDFVHPEDQASTLAAVENLSRGEPAIQFLNRYRHMNGHYLWLEWNARSVPEEAAIYAVARDVTERVRAAGPENTLEDVLGLGFNGA